MSNLDKTTRAAKIAETDAKWAAHDTPDRRQNQETERCLRKMAEYERLGHRPAAGTFNMSELKAGGLIETRHEGWGHYSIKLTRAGRRALGDVE